MFSIEGKINYILDTRLKKTEIRSQKSEVRNQKSEVRNQKSEIRRQESEYRSWKQRVKLVHRSGGGIKITNNKPQITKLIRTSVGSPSGWINSNIKKIKSQTYFVC